MEQGLVQVYSGEGHGKSAAALGRAIQVAGTGRNVVIINFLKGNQSEAFLKRMEPETREKLKNAQAGKNEITHHHAQAPVEVAP